MCYTFAILLFNSVYALKLKIDNWDPLFHKFEGPYLVLILLKWGSYLALILCEGPYFIEMWVPISKLAGPKWLWTPMWSVDTVL